jgi:hypothetical protein
MMGVFVGSGASFEIKALVAIGTFDEMLVAHFQEDAWMAQRSAAAVTGNAGLVGFDDFRDFDRHGKASETGQKTNRWPGSYKLRSGSQGRIDRW